MGKFGVLGINHLSLLSQLELKKQYLMFDKIYIENNILKMSEKATESYKDFAKKFDLSNNEIAERVTKEFAKKLDGGIFGSKIAQAFRKANEELIQYNLSNIQVLREEGFIEVVDMVIKDEVIKSLDNDLYFRLKDDKWDEKVKGNSDWTLTEFPEMLTRLTSLFIQHTQKIDAYPLLASQPKESKNTRKTDVLNFILGNIPEPDDSVPWEQLKDFKADNDTKAKYAALIHWINKVAKQETPFHEIIDEYEFHYHGYVDQYQKHKLKHKLGNIETLVTATVDLLSGQFGLGSFSTALFSIYKKNADLLDAETKFTGREVAYIYKAEQTFGK